MDFQSFHPNEGATVSIPATASSANVQVVAAGTTNVGPTQMRIHNAGPSTAFVKKGNDSTVAATLPNGSTPGDFPLPAGAIEVITVYHTDNGPQSANDGIWFAAICASGGTATVYITPGTGL